jgi:hypothetical protein
MPSLLTLAWILVAAAIGWLVYDWSVIGSGVRAWWRRRQMRIAAKKAARFRLPWRVRLDYLATIEQKKPITPKAAR